MEQNILFLNQAPSDLVRASCGDENCNGYYCCWVRKDSKVENDGCPMNILCANQEGGVQNTSTTESTLVKTHIAINYHVICQSAAMGMLRVLGKVDTETNVADFLTKAKREATPISVIYCE